MHPCPVCGSQYPSYLAAEECGEAERVEDLRLRQLRAGRG